jgi:hypothetical protein
MPSRGLGSLAFIVVTEAFTEKGDRKEKRKDEKRANAKIA